MTTISRSIAWCSIALALVCAAAIAQTPDKSTANPAAILAAAKAASGGAAWDSLTSLHTLVALRAGGYTGGAERWSEIVTGRSYLRFELGPMSGALGFEDAIRLVLEDCAARGEAIPAGLSGR